MTDQEAREQHWHLDKRVSIGLLISVAGIIVTLAVQTYIVGQWVGTTNERLDQIERRMENSALRAQNVDILVAQQATNIAVLVERIDAQNRRIEETNNLLREYLRRNGGGQP